MTTKDAIRSKTRGSKILNKGGRPPGSPNKTSALAKENIIAVFNRLGGTAGMAEWAKENQTEFYRLYGRLVPVEGSGEQGQHFVEVSWRDS
jgi:hypothetical protein